MLGDILGTSAGLAFSLIVLLRFFTSRALDFSSGAPFLGFGLLGDVTALPEALGKFGTVVVAGALAWPLGLGFSPAVLGALAWAVSMEERPDFLARVGAGSGSDMSSIICSIPFPG